LWAAHNIGGVIFVNQLPYRFYPMEDHTTGLPLINYLPDRLTLAAARRFSPRIEANATWPDLLRAGFAGAPLARFVRICCAVVGMLGCWFPKRWTSTTTLTCGTGTQPNTRSGTSR